jgi:hypothetical protein
VPTPFDKQLPQQVRVAMAADLLGVLPLPLRHCQPVTGGMQGHHRHLDAPGGGEASQPVDCAHLCADPGGASQALKVGVQVQACLLVGLLDKPALAGVGELAAVVDPGVPGGVPAGQPFHLLPGVGPELHRAKHVVQCLLADLPGDVPRAWLQRTGPPGDAGQGVGQCQPDPARRCGQRGRWPAIESAVEHGAGLVVGGVGRDHQTAERGAQRGDRGAGGAGGDDRKRAPFRRSGGQAEQGPAGSPTLPGSPRDGIRHA